MPFSVPFWQSKKEHDDSRNSRAKLALAKQKLWLSKSEGLYTTEGRNLRAKQQKWLSTIRRFSTEAIFGEAKRNMTIVVVRLAFFPKLDDSMHNTDNPIKGILAMLLAVLLFSAMDAAMKQLTANYGPMQITCLRAACAWPFIMLWLAKTDRLKHLLQARWSLHFFRAVLGIIMLAAFIKSLETLSLADAYSIFFASPLLITLLSVWWLKDKVNTKQWVAIFVGLAAVIYMLKPTGDNLLSIGALMVFIAAICYAVSAITVRILAKSDHAGNMVFWLMTLIMVGAGALAFPTWQPLQLDHWPLFLVIGCTGAAGQVFITEAFRLAPPAVIAPFEYTALIWGLGFDIVLWQHYPSLSMLLGAGVIMASGLYLIWQQNRSH